MCDRCDMRHPLSLRSNVAMICSMLLFIPLSVLEPEVFFLLRFCTACTPVSTTISLRLFLIEIHSASLASEPALTVIQPEL